MLICQLTDLHVRPRGRPASRVSETNMLVERALCAVAAFSPRPDAVVITGDLTDCGLPAEYELLNSLLRRILPVPIFVIPGNHDRRETLRAGLSHLPGLDGNADYIQYAVEDLPLRLVMLDTVVPGAAHGELRPTQLDWLDRTLAAAPDRPTLIAMHHPPFVCGIANLDAINLKNAASLAAVIARHSQVERIICGHHHRAITGRVAQVIATVSPSVVHQVEMTLDPGAEGGFVFEPPAFQLHRWTPADGLVTHTVYVERFPGPYPFLPDDEYPGQS